MFIPFLTGSFIHEKSSKVSILVLTSAGNTHIFIVVTVVDAPAQATALAELRFASSAVHVVQHDAPSALSKLGAAGHRHSHPAPQLTTHHVGVHHVPVIVAHRAPRAVVLHLHSTLTPVPPIHQLDFGETGDICQVFASAETFLTGTCFCYEKDRLARL